jgi:hypothetical protein
VHCQKYKLIDYSEDALKLSTGKFDTEMNITFNMKVDLRWWLDNLWI